MIGRVAREDGWKIAAYTAILVVNLVFTALAFPTFETHYTLVVNLVPDFLGVVKKALLSAGHDRLAVFLGINHFFKGANVVGSAAAIVLALGTVVREVETGTIVLLLSRPVSRRRLLASWAAVHLLGLVAPLVVLSAFVPELVHTLVGREAARGPMLLGALHASAFVFAAYAISLVFAVTLSEQIHVATAAGSLFVLSFLLYFVDATRPYTLFRLSSMDVYLDLARGGAFAWPEFFGCLALGVASLIAAAFLFERRDF